jgi:serine/threonine protein kinase
MRAAFVTAPTSSAGSQARAGISSLNHPNLCALYDIGCHDGVGFLVMEYLEGETLAKPLTAGPLPLDRALPIAIALADALAFALRSGIVHRDIKPQTVILTASGSKLLDFGLSEILKSGATKQRQVLRPHRASRRHRLASLRKASSSADRR